MEPIVSEWSGDDWQEHILLLLKRHYGPGQFQEIPDADRGDAGLEGYADNGCCYQCYAAENPHSAADLLAKQKRKIQRDIRKLCKNKDLLLKILGTVKISRWIFVVPRFNSKDLLIYAQEKTAEVLKLGLPHLAADFRIKVTNADEFAVERQALLGVGLAKVPVVPTQPLPAEVAAWTAGNEKLVRILDGKAGRMRPGWDESKRNRFREEMIQRHVAAQNSLTALHVDYGELYEQIVQLQEQHEQLLAAESMTATTLPPQLLRDTIERFERMLAENVLGLDGHTAKVIAWGAVADWMLRCPLDFEAVA